MGPDLMTTAYSVSRCLEFQVGRPQWMSSVDLLVDLDEKVLKQENVDAEEEVSMTPNQMERFIDDVCSST